MTPLPSSVSAHLAVSGDARAVPLLALHTVGRAIILAGGLYAAGLRGRQLTRGALFGALAIELFVLAWHMKGGPDGTADFDGR